MSTHQIKDQGKALLRMFEKTSSQGFQGILQKQKKDVLAECLRLCASENKVECAKLVLEKGCDIDQKCFKKNLAPIQLAYLLKHMDMFQILAEYGADLFIRDFNGMTLLHHACIRHDAFMVQWLLSKDLDVNDLDDNERNALLCLLCSVSEHGKIKESFDLLMEKGACIDAPDKYRKRTPLHFACKNNYTAEAKKLIEAGADVHAQDNKGMQPLHEAAKEKALKSAQLLVEVGADIDVEDSDGKRPLDYALDWGAPDVVAFLVEKGASLSDLDARNVIGTTTNDAFKAMIQKGLDIEASTDEYFFYACLKNQLEKAKLLLAYNPDVNYLYRCSRGYDETPLTASKDINLVRLLLDQGADINKVACKEKKTPLFIAVYYKYEDLALFLLERGANPNLKTADGRIPLHAAVGNYCLKEKESVALIEALVQAGSDVNMQCNTGETPMHSLKGVRGIEVAKILLKHGADIGIRDNEGDTALISALKRGDEEVASFLLDQENNQNLEEVFLFAMVNSRLKIIRRALKINTFLVNICDDNHLTSLHWACSHNNTELVHLLLEFKADINALDKEGNSPLMHAITHQTTMEEEFHWKLVRNTKPSEYDAWRSRKTEIVRELINHGSDVNQKNHEGVQPIVQAAVFANQDVWELLLESGADPSNLIENKGVILAEIEKVRRERLEEFLRKLGLKL